LISTLMDLVANKGLLTQFLVLRIYLSWLATL
jgi:hypothetical protein